MKENWLPEKKILIIVIILSLVGLANYIIMYQTPPDGRTFTAYVDAGFQLAVMKSVVWGFQSPWDFGISVFENPHLGGPYILVTLGTIPTLLAVPLIPYFLAVRLVLSVVVLVLVYNVIRYLVVDKKKTNTAFLLFLLAAGVGWIIYGLAFGFFGHGAASNVAYIFTYEFEEGDSGAHALSHISRIYWIAPEITGMAALLLFFRRRRVLAGIFMGITWLFHPTFGLPFSLILFIYSLTENYGTKRFVENTVKDVLPVAVLSAIFFSPWIIFSTESPEHFLQYKEWFNSMPLVTIVVSTLFLLSFSVYGLCRTGMVIIKNRLFALAFLVFGLLSSVAHIYEFSYLYEQPYGGSTVTDFLKHAGIFDQAALLYSKILFVDIPLLLLFAMIFLSILKMNMDKNYKFVLLSAVAVFIITIIPVQAIGNLWWPARMKWFLLFPLSIAAAYGIDAFARSHGKLLGRTKITPMRIATVIAVVSLPTLLGFNYHILQVAHTSDISYVSNEDYGAMNFLAGQPPGRVLSSYEVGHSIPYYTGKMSLLFNNVRGERYSDYETFYSSNSTEKEKLEVLEKYNITYVFYGEHEKKIDKTFNPDSLNFLRKIYDNSTYVYTVIK